MYDSCAQPYAHIYEQFLKMSVGLGLGLDFLCICLGLAILCVFSFCLDYFVPVLFAFVVFALVSSVQCQEIDWEERLRNDPVYFVWSGM